MVGIKETKEAINGVNALAIFIIGRMKDGIGFDDAIALFQKATGDEEFKAVLLTAFDGISQVPEEIKDISIAESVELATMAIDFIPKYIEAFKKEEVK